MHDTVQTHLNTYSQSWMVMDSEQSHWCQCREIGIPTGINRCAYFTTGYVFTWERGVWLHSWTLILGWLSLCPTHPPSLIVALVLPNGRTPVYGLVEAFSATDWKRFIHILYVLYYIVIHLLLCVCVLHSDTLQWSSGLHVIKPIVTLGIFTPLVFQLLIKCITTTNSLFPALKWVLLRMKS